MDVNLRRVCTISHITHIDPHVSAAGFEYIFVCRCLGSPQVQKDFNLKAENSSKQGQMVVFTLGNI